MVKMYCNQKDLPYSSVGLIIPPDVYIPTFKVMPDAPDGRWLSDYEKVQEYIKEQIEKKK
ncbi:MAG: hypothetical protein GYA62_09130 [Bacteroidales bacterium]|nr:hypothetical protein [Bacteroidales bacterium]